MSRVPAQSSQSRAALEVVSSLQQRFVKHLEALERPFLPAEWLRDAGVHGGGLRFGRAESARFNRASVNVSQVHYEADPQRALACATALSTIIHPTHPRAPSVHIHVSCTEPHGRPASWRMMADLNPSLPDDTQTRRYAQALRAAAPALADRAQADGDRYFFIPALERTRGVTHFYVEGYGSEDFDADARLARTFGQAAIDTYAALLQAAPTGEATDEERRAQRQYHTLYFFQVLTLDRGTTSGLLAHEQNDLGVMGSLPSHIDVSLLASWAPRTPAPLQPLVHALVDAAGDGHITDAVRGALAQTVRAHFKAHPEALAHQAVTPAPLPAHP